jgi:UDP-glucose 4-epimerase
MKIVITGARGRLGCVLRRYFEAAGDDVLAFSRNADFRHTSLSSLPDVLRGGHIDVILHLAWSTVPATAEKVPGVEWREDLPLLSELLSVMAARRGAASRLVFFSTCAVYGEPRAGQVFTETDALSPKGWYASGKAAAEQLLDRFGTEHEVASCVLRVTNPYGFTQAEQCLQGVIPAMFTAARKNEEFSAWGDGDAVKDYLHIDDLCVAVDRVVRANLTGTFNVASGVSRSLSSVVQLIEQAVGVPMRVRHTEPRLWDVRHGRYNHQALTVATGWTPQVDFAEGIRRFNAGAVDPT